MFVPELGQPDSTIYKNLTMNELVFKNPFDHKFELELERKLQKFSSLRFIKRLLSPARKLHTVGGFLLTSL